MPSNNSYTYYNRFLRCLERYLEKIVDSKRKLAEKYKWKVYDLEKLEEYTDENGKETIITPGIIRQSFEYVFDKLIEKAPSACMGADSGNNGLPEPPAWKVKALIEHLEKYKVTVHRKKNLAGILAA